MTQPSNASLLTNNFVGNEVFPKLYHHHHMFSKLVLGLWILEVALFLLLVAVVVGK